MGGCNRILGVFLGNLGYRIPDPAAVDGMPVILQKLITFQGDALLDIQQYDRRFDCPITIINALTKTEGDLTETEKIGELGQEGQRIARGFIEAVQGRSRSARVSS